MIFLFFLGKDTVYVVKHKLNVYLCELYLMAKRFFNIIV